MSSHDNPNDSASGRHLRLVDLGAGAGNSGSTRASNRRFGSGQYRALAPSSSGKRLLSQRGSSGLQGSVRAVAVGHGADGSAPTDAALCQRYAGICARIAGGGYDDPAVLLKVAEQIVERRELDCPSADN